MKTSSQNMSAIDDIVRIDLRQGVVRVLIGMAAGALATALLYWLMSALVAAGQNALTKAPAGGIIDFVRVPNPPQLRTEQPKPEMPPKPDKAPETPEMRTEVAKPSGDTVHIGAMDIDSSLAVDTRAGLSAADGEYLPIVKVAPVYPRRALSRGIEGWVLLRFTVTENGSVINPEVIDAEPSGVFDRAAMAAVERFKYKPRVVDGVAQVVHGVEHLITFELEQESGR